MKLKEFLSLLADEDVRIELILDIEKEPNYQYISFWLSDYRVKESDGYSYKDWKIEDISFNNVSDIYAQISILIEPYED